MQRGLAMTIVFDFPNIRYLICLFIYFHGLTGFVFDEKHLSLWDKITILVCKNRAFSSL